MKCSTTSVGAKLHT